jgi:anaerobic magnesium-protoporphyrin IX monomethyl ester cyclase
LPQVVLFFPKTEPRREWAVLPLSLLFLAAVLKAAGCRVTIVDARIEQDWRQALVQALKSSPLFFGVSSMTGYQIAGGVQASRILRDLHPQVPVVWGGVHPSLLPEETLRAAAADIVVRGEGEIPVLALAQALRDHADLREVPGISFLEGGNPVHNPDPALFDLESLPPIPYELLPVEKYGAHSPWRGTEGSISYLTSKGCPFHCAYCYNQSFYHRKWRGKSPAKVIQELAEMTCRWKPLKIFLLDDNFFVDLPRVEQIVAGLLSSALRPEIYNVNCRVDTLLRMDLSLLKNLREAGIKQLFIGLESGSDPVLQSIRKGFSREMILEADRKLLAASLEPVYSFMAGFPGETPQDVGKTLRLMVDILEQNPKATITELSFYSPFPGTELLDRLRVRGLALPLRLEEWADISYNRLVGGLFPAEVIRRFVNAKLMSSQLDTKYARRTGRTKRLLARLLAWEIRLRIKTGMISFFPEKVFLNKYRLLKHPGKRGG